MHCENQGRVSVTSKTKAVLRSDSIAHYHRNLDFLNDKAKYYPRDGGRASPIKNCYLSDIGSCKEGNSGGPLFQGEKVVAMLSGNQDYGDFSKDRYIKSEYMMSILRYIKEKSNRLCNNPDFCIL